MQQCRHPIQEKTTFPSPGLCAIALEARAAHVDPVSLTPYTWREGAILELRPAHTTYQRQDAIIMGNKNQRLRRHVDPVVLEFASELRRRLGPHVREMQLFGSRARDEGRDDSDYDMLVVVDHRTPELRAVILEIETQLMDRYDVLVATVLRSEEEWRKGQGFPLARNIAREGVVL